MHALLKKIFLVLKRQIQKNWWLMVFVILRMWIILKKLMDFILTLTMIQIMMSSLFMIQADNIIGEYEENTQHAELDYSMYNMIPISFEHADQVAVNFV